MNSNKPPTLALPNSFDAIFFVTLRLLNALPESFGQNLALQYYSIKVKFDQSAEHSVQLHQARKRLFARFDQALDWEKYGRAYLREPSLAQIVADEIRRRDGSDYGLLAHTILPNHVHLLLDLQHTLVETPVLDDLESYGLPALRDILTNLQQATEAPLKKTIEQLGEHIDPTIFQHHRPGKGAKLEGNLWHDRTFDFHVTNAPEFEKITRYILQNPVQAALADDWQNWPFSFYKG